MKLNHAMLSGLVMAGLMLTGMSTGPSARRSPMELGNFSVSLTVKDIQASKAFYEKLGFVQILGDAGQGWAIMKNGSTNFGLFQGMFERNMLTFNPRWDQNGAAAAKSEDVRSIQKRLKDAGVDVGAAIESAQGPGSFSVKDPDGNPILFDQHL